MQVAVFHPGTQHSRQTALALQELGKLEWLATSLFSRADRPRLPGRVGRFVDDALARQEFPALAPSLVRTHGAIEWSERIAARMGFPKLAQRLDAWGNARFGTWVAGQAARSDAPLALWGYDGVANTCFADPRTSALPRILDRTIADLRVWNRERETILSTHPDWLGGGLPVASQERIASDQEEYDRATAILCGSPFVAESIRGEAPIAGIADKLRVLPYTFDRALFGGAPEPQLSPLGAPVRFLFAGQVSARKGIQHVVEAFSRIPAGAATLTLAGPMMVPERLIAAHSDRIEWVGSIPRREMPALMRRHDVFVFPSYFEGSAIVLLEALASGLAIIQSKQAGYGASAESGIVLDRPSTDGVEEAIASLIADRDRLLAMRRAALAESSAFEFGRYRGRIAELLLDLGI